VSKVDSIQLPSDPRFIDLTGRVFSRLTVVRYSQKRGNNHRWLVQCECGSLKEVQGSNLTSGHTSSCGCLAREVLAVTRMRAPKKITHGMSYSAEYRAWDCMWRRCTNPKHPSHEQYKDRRPPDAWRDFSVFYAEVGPKPGPGFSLDRIDNNRPYEPGNVRWADSRTQSRNKASNIFVVTPDGQTLILTDACQSLGMNYRTVLHRKWRGWSIQEASNGLLKEAA
jgi:hypothetical protein